MIDIRPAARRTVDLIESLDDDELGLPTPCPEAQVGDLVDHLGVFAVRFLAAARKEAPDGTAPPPPRRANLEPGWRDRIARDLLALADAWGEPEAWEGSTHAGGLAMPAEVVGLVTLDELVVHGWDVAAATGRSYEPTAPEIEAATAFVVSFDAPRDSRLFGPVVSVPDRATPLDHLLGLTGRDPAWQPPG